VNYDGEAKPCRARTRPCPFGDDSVHFPTEDAARAFYEKSMSEKILTFGRWRDRIALDDGYQMLLEKNIYGAEYGWLRTPDGVAVGMLHWRMTDDDFPIINDIEVRPGYRGQGYAKKMILTVEKLTGKTLRTTGGFTPEGWAALGQKIPVDERYASYPEPGIHYDSMNFVQDWNKLQTR